MNNDNTSMSEARREVREMTDRLAASMAAIGLDPAEIVLDLIADFEKHSGPLVPRTRRTVDSMREATRVLRAGVRHSARLLLVRDGRVYASAWPKRPKDLMLPGGGVDQGESFELAAQREAFEEMGIKVKLDRELYRGEWHTDRPGIAVTYLVTEWEGEPKAMDEEAGCPMRWVLPSELLHPDCYFREYNEKVVILLEATL